MPQLSLDLTPSVSPAAPVWAFGGSRILSADASAVSGRAALALLASGADLVMGCCKGADACALSAAVDAGLAGRVSVLSAFGVLDGAAHPPGACAWSAVGEVRRAVAAGASIRPWAGGGALVPLRARLAARTRAVARAGTAGALVVLAPGSRGAVLLANAVADRGLPVVLIPVSGASLSSLFPGRRISSIRVFPLADLSTFSLS